MKAREGVYNGRYRTQIETWKSSLRPLRTEFTSALVGICAVCALQLLCGQAYSHTLENNWKDKNRVSHIQKKSKI